MALVYALDDVGRWGLAQTLAGGGAAEGAQFGSAGIALAGDRLLVGAHGDTGAALASGAAHLFQRGENGEWRQTRRLVAHDGATNDQYGLTVALADGWALVGAHLHGDEQRARTGAAYAHALDGGRLCTTDGACVCVEGAAGPTCAERAGR